LQFFDLIDAPCQLLIEGFKVSQRGTEARAFSLGCVTLGAYRVDLEQRLSVGQTHIARHLLPAQIAVVKTPVPQQRAPIVLQAVIEIRHGPGGFPELGLLGVVA
jgi:hypothetical protein